MACKVKSRSLVWSCVFLYGLAHPAFPAWSLLVSRTRSVLSLPLILVKLVPLECSFTFPPIGEFPAHPSTSSQVSTIQIEAFLPGVFLSSVPLALCW